MPQPPGYPAYPPAVPTSPTPARGYPPPQRGPGPRPGPVPQGFAPPGQPGPGGPRRRTPPRRGTSRPRRPRAADIVRAVPHLIRDLPNHRPWMITLGFLAAAVVLGTCGLGSYLLVKDDQMVIGGVDPSASATIPPRDISSRKTDPDPLTVADVFPVTEIIADPSVPPYKRIGNAQVVKDCRTGATADVGKLLLQLGCNQVIRATFMSPDGDYLITAGVFNLRDSAAARQGHGEINTLVDNGRGRLTGYISTAAARVLGRAPTHLAWEAEGHFLLYSVIVRVNGKQLVPDDPHLKVMVYDILQKYLRDKVIAQWAVDRAALASASPSAASPGTQ